MKLPELDQPVFVINGEYRLPSRVQQVLTADTISVDLPETDGVALSFPAGSPTAIEWTSERGVVRGEGTVLPMPADVTFAVFHARLESSKVVQRREHVRIDIVVDAELRQASGVPVEIKTVDLSGGGMRAFVPRDLIPGESVSVSLLFNDQPTIGANAEVIRGNREDGYAFRFVVVDAKEHERLVKWIFETHRRGFATVRRS